MQRQVPTTPGEVLVPAAHGVARAPRAGRATRRPPAPGRAGLRARPGRGSSRRPPRSPPAAPGRSPGPTGAPWPGHHHGVGADRFSTRSRRGRPVHRPAVAAEAGHAVAGGGLLDEVAGEQHVGVLHPHDEVAAGVAAPGVHQLDQAVAEVERRRGGEGARGQHRFGRRRARRSAGPRPTSAAACARISAAWAGSAAAASSWATSSGALGRRTRRCRRCGRSARGCSPRRPAERRKAGVGRPAPRGRPRSEALVSTTSRPARPATTLTFTSNHA